MPNSPLRKYPYPSISDSAIVPNDMRRLAEAVDADVSTVAGSAISAVTRAAELAELVSGIRSILTIKVDDGGSTATITYTNGTTERITLPRGPAGESAGPFVDLIDNGDGTATVVLYDGTTRTLTLPEGEPGAPGEPGPANTLSIGTVTAGDTASATIRGTAPNQVIDLVLPRGEKGDTGDAGGLMDTGWRNIGLLAEAGANDQVCVRRVGQLVYLRMENATAGVRWTPASGFTPDDTYQSRVADPSAGPTTPAVNAFPKVVSAPTRVAVFPNSLSSTGMIYYFTADPWPTTLPGTPR